MYRTTQFWHVLMTIFCTCTNLHVTRLWCKKIPRQIMPIIDQYWMAHCPKNNLNLGIKTEPVTYGSDATVYSRSCLWDTHTSMYTVYICTIACPPAVTGSIFMQRLRLFLGQSVYLVSWYLNHLSITPHT